MITARSRKQRKLNIDWWIVAFIAAMLLLFGMIAVGVHEFYSIIRDRAIAVENMPVNIEEFKTHYQSTYGLTPITHSCNDDGWPYCNVSFFNPEGEPVAYRVTCDIDECKGELP